MPNNTFQKVVTASCLPLCCSISSLNKSFSGSDQEIKSLLTVPYPLAELCFTVGNFKQSLFGLVEANISVWEQPLYQMPPAVCLRMISRYDSHKIKLSGEECCLYMQWQQCEGCVWFQSTEENPIQPILIAFKAMRWYCKSMATILWPLRLAIRNPAFNLREENSKELEGLKD